MKTFEVTYIMYNRKYKATLKGKDKKEVLRFFAMYMLGKLVSIEEVIKWVRTRKLTERLNVGLGIVFPGMVVIKTKCVHI